MSDILNYVRDAVGRKYTHKGHDQAIKGWNFYSIYSSGVVSTAQLKSHAAGSICRSIQTGVQGTTREPRTFQELFWSSNYIWSTWSFVFYIGVGD